MRCSSLLILIGLLLATANAPSAQCPQGTTTARNGSGINATCFSSLTPPDIGTTWSVTVDASANPSATWTLVELRALGSTGPVVSFGEILIDQSSAFLARSIRGITSGTSRHDYPLPPNIALSGLAFSGQAAVGGAGLALCNALDVVIGCPPPPVAQLTGFATLGVAPHDVTFTDLSTGLHSTWLWDFGDGTTSTLETPTHTYANAGTYDVSLTVTGPGGSDTRTRTAFVDVVAPTSVHGAWTLEATQLISSNPAVNPKIQILELGLNVVHEFADPLPGYGYAEISKPLAGGGLLSSIYDRNTRKKIVAEIGPTGNVLWQYDPAPMFPTAEVERLPNGNTLVLCSHAESWPALHATDPILNEYVLEVDPTGTVVWSWGLAQHWNDLPFTAAERAYFFNFPGAPGLAKPIFHTNSVAPLPPNRWEASDSRFEEGNLIFSLREASVIFIVDRTTEAVVWSYDDLHGQHHARMIPMVAGGVGTPSLAGAGNILLFDNGGDAGAPPTNRPYSRLLEIDPTTNEVVWSYEDHATFYSTRMGSVQRLSNGNTFFTEGENGVLKEIDPNGTILWTHVRSSPARIFRGYRIEFDWMSAGFVFPW